MSGAWGCPHESEELCQRVNGAYCKPGMRGCVLDGKVELADERSRQPRWPSRAVGEEREPAPDLPVERPRRDR